MKFLCDNCKAKYQIPDEKVSGRTLRMKCRKCAYNIIIRGPRPDRVASTSTVPPDGPKQASKAKKPRVKTKSVPKRASKPLGAAFRSRVAAPPPPMSAATGDQKVWHCAINDVPIGPIKREELGRKIATKALNGDSLVWREGFDDWRPLKNIPELAQLLTRSRAPRAPTRPARPPARVPPPKAPAPLHSPAASGSQERTAARAGGSNVIPIGGRMGASAAQAFVPAPAPEPPSPEDDFDDEATVLSDNPLQFLAKAAEKPKIPSPRKPGTGPFAKANADAKNADARNADARNAGAWAVPKKTPPVATPPKTEDTAPAKPTAEPSVEPPAPADDGSLDLRFSMPMEAPIEAPIEAPSDPFGLGDVSPSDVGSTPLDEPLSGGFAAPPEEEEDDDEAAVILAGAMPLSRGGGMPIGAWIAIAGAMAFGVALAIVVGTKLMQEPTPVAVVTPPEEPAPVAEPEVEAPVDPPAEVEEATDVADEIEAATAEGETDTPNMSGRTKRVRTRDRSGMTGAAGTAAAPSMDDNLTPAQRALLEEMSRGDDTTSVMTKGLGRMSAMRGEPLSADAVRRVVNNNSNQRALRRCYETSIRGMPSPPTVRFDVRVSVGPSGTVTSVRAGGSNEISGLKPCIERAVRRWRFPSSSGGATPQFPLVFHGAG